MSFKPTAHPVLANLTAAQAVSMGKVAWTEAMTRREQIIRDERADPFRCGWEPPIWKVCDALLGFPWVDAAWAERLRQRLGFQRPVRILLINGGNRAGKTHYAAKRTMQILRLLERDWKVRGWAFHKTLAMSAENQQPLFLEFLPAELRARDFKEKVTYIAYKQKQGFSDGKFVLPTGAEQRFLAYEQDKTNIEGGNLDIVWPDEHVPADWIETLELRIAERDGWMIVTFTPTEGYSDAVKLFQDGAETVMESTAFLCPKDGGPPDVARALGLSAEQLAELDQASAAKRAACAPASVPENCLAWAEGQPGQPAVPAGREFETVPRVMRCAGGEGKRAVVFFHSSDNPYGNPLNVWRTVADKPREFIRERFYGIAHRLKQPTFPKFNARVHVIAAETVPSAGTNYHLVDGASGRNLFMLWIRVVGNQAYVYREFPGPHYIRGVGVPGPWALPDGKKADGRPGPAQNSFGWGYLEYKRQIAELEGWHAARQPQPGDLTEAEWIESWREEAGTDEPIARRSLDSRWASAPKLENDRPRTALTDFEDIGLFFHTTPGNPIHEGKLAINALLSYDETRPMDAFNHPHLFISNACPNLLFSLQTWSGDDGNKGACKDPIDCLHYFASDECPDLEGTPESDDNDEPTPNQYY